MLYTIRPWLNYGVLHVMLYTIRPWLNYGVLHVMLYTIRPWLNHGVLHVIWDVMLFNTRPLFFYWLLHGLLYIHPAFGYISYGLWIRHQLVLKVKFGDKRPNQATLFALALPDAKSSTKRSWNSWSFLGGATLAFAAKTCGASYGVNRGPLHGCSCAGEWDQAWDKGPG